MKYYSVLSMIASMSAESRDHRIGMTRTKRFIGLPLAGTALGLGLTSCAPSEVQAPSIVLQYPCKSTPDQIQRVNAQWSLETINCNPLEAVVLVENDRKGNPTTSLANPIPIADLRGHPSKGYFIENNAVQIIFSVINNRITDVSIQKSTY